MRKQQQLSLAKKKAKKRSRAYLAELKELKRTERKYVIGNQETTEFKLYVNRKGEEVDEPEVWDIDVSKTNLVL